MTDPEQQSVQVAIAEREGRTVATASGEIDAASADTFERGVRPAIAESADLLLDLSEVSFMDSSGLRALMGLHAEVTQRGGHIELVGTSSVVDRLLSVTGLDELFIRPT